MRIDRFVIRGYGPLEPRTLDFTAGVEGLHVVHGGNEWGKSLSLQALEQALFAIPKKIDGFSESAMKQLDLELGIRRRFGDQSAESCVFRRTRLAVLNSADSMPIDERQVIGYLGGITAESFRQMYGLSGERIREGGRLLQKSKGDNIASTLFAAATGLERIRDVAGALLARQRELYVPGGRTAEPRLKAAIGALRQSFSAYSSALQLPEAVARIEVRLRDKQVELAVVEEEIAGCSRRTGHLSRVRAARSSAIELHAARQRLAGLGSPPLLVASFQKRLVAAREAIARADTLESQQKETLRKQRDKRDALVIDDQVAVVASEIPEVVASTEELLGIDASIPEQAREIAGHTESNERRFASIAATTGTPLRESAPQASDTHKQIEDLIAAHGGIAEACEQRASRLKESRDALARIQEQLEQLPVVDDITAPDARVQSVREVGDLEKQLAAKGVELTDLEHDHAAACRQLDGRQTDEPVDTLRVPTSAEVRAYREEFRGFTTAGGQIDAEQRTVTEQIAMLESQIALLEQEADLPAEGQLEESRRVRDAAIVATEANAVEGRLAAAELPARFQEIVRLVREADEIVDRLLVHADRSSQRRQHRIAIERLKGQLDRLASRRVDLAKRVADTEQAWSELWQKAGVIPKSPLAMEEWLALHAECRTRAAALGKLGREIAGLERSIAADQGVLAGVFVDIGIASPQGATRRQLLDAATAALEGMRKQAENRQRKVDEAAKIEQSLPGLEEQLAREIKRRDAWNQRWADCMAVLAQPSGVSTDTARFLLETMRDVAATEEKIAAVRKRIAEMETRRQEIHGLMHTVCEALGIMFDARAVREISREAGDRLEASKAVLREQERLANEIGESEDGIRKTRVDRDDAEAVIVALREEAVAGPDGNLDEAWSASERFRQVQSQVDEWEQKFLREAGHANAQSLLDECVATTSEAIDDELAVIERDAPATTTERDGLRDEVNELARQMAAFGGERAARLRAECSVHEAEVLGRVAEYMPLRLASLALERASRRYREEHHSPVLGRASVLFGKITRGRYAEVKLVENDIYAVRADAATETVPQRFMSEGTRDQLYLALRLASLEHSHEQGAEPLPLILDDGLVQFDDDRMAAMLEVLADVSGGMQVILFTHHKSVVDAARSLQAKRADAVFVHGDV